MSTQTTTPDLGATFPPAPPAKRYGRPATCLILPDVERPCRACGRQANPLHTSSWSDRGGWCGGCCAYCASGHVPHVVGSLAPPEIAVSLSEEALELRPAGVYPRLRHARAWIPRSEEDDLEKVAFIRAVCARLREF